MPLAWRYSKASVTSAVYMIDMGSSKNPATDNKLFTSYYYLCIMPLAWRYSKASVTSAVYMIAMGSSKNPVTDNKLFTSNNYLCIMPLAWRYSKASVTSAVYMIAMGSSKNPATDNKLFTSPPIKYSITCNQTTPDLQSLCTYAGPVRPPDKGAQLNFFFISQPKHMLRVLKRTISLRRFF